MFCDYSKLVTSYKKGEVPFDLLGTNSFHAKAKNERLTAVDSRCRQNFKYENFTPSFGRVVQNIKPESVPHVQHDYLSSFNQSNHGFVALTLPLPSSFPKLCPRKRGSRKWIRAPIPSRLRHCHGRSLSCNDKSSS